MEITSTTLTVSVRQNVSGVSFDVPDTYGKDEFLVCKTFARTTDFEPDGRSDEHYSGRGVKRLANGLEGTGNRIIYSLRRKDVPAEVLAVLDENVADQVSDLGITYTAPKENA